VPPALKDLFASCHHAPAPTDRAGRTRRTRRATLVATLAGLALTGTIGGSIAGPAQAATSTQTGTHPARARAVSDGKRPA
jgi:hypothetical protein